MMEMVEDWEWQRVGEYLSVPYSILLRINSEYSTFKEKMYALASYIAAILPNITWEKVATVLYQWDQHRAVERVRTYLHTILGDLITILSWFKQPRVIVGNEKAL